MIKFSCCNKLTEMACLSCRHGYPITFIDRRMLLQHLYDSLRQKHKVLAGKRVISVVKSDDASVVVRTEDGSSYSGDILVGADGVHSRVRREMARLDPAHVYIESACEFPIPTTVSKITS
jgi:2-polyprenyl-6-methoxyphenol hydroxylase-like FAD-dependent oxidoreductase